MFSEMVAKLKEGELPDPALLRGRCHAAVTKKLAFVRLPPVYWESDPKRNPDSSHLLWAVLLLDDPDMLDIVKGVILMEQAEREGLSLEEFVQRSLNDLYALAPCPQFLALLKTQVARSTLYP